MNPRISQDEMQQIYKSSEYWNEIGYKDYLAGEAIRIENSERRWNFCSRFLPERGRLLDVGCATGFFGAVAARHRFEVVGIDGAADMIAFGKKTYGLDLRVSTLEACTLEPGQFDVVSLWGTDSHFFDVREGFQKLIDWLKPGGHLLFSYQDYAHWIRVFFPQIKRNFNVYYNFTRASFHLLMQQLSAEVLAERTDVQTTQLHRVIHTMGLKVPFISRLGSLKVTIPTISYKVVVARKTR